MHQRIGSVIPDIRQDVARHLSAAVIHRVCREAGHVWRRCVLDPATIIHVFIIQILNGNTALNHLRHLTGLNLTAQAFGAARKRLPLEVFRLLLKALVSTLRDGREPAGLWHGHRTFSLDGSGCSMPDTPALQKHFGQPSNQRPGCGFPVAHLLALFDSATGFLIDLLPSPLKTHDMSVAALLHPALRAGDVLVGDRGFCSFAHFGLLIQRGIHGLFRLHQRLKFLELQRGETEEMGKVERKRENKAKSRTARALRRLGVSDYLAEWTRPKQRPGWMTASEFAALPEKLVCRILSYNVSKRGYRTKRVTLVTTLLDAEVYTVDDLAELYRQRWQVETNFKHLKITMHMDVLHCKTVDGVLKEMLVFALVYNLVRMVMVEAARRQTRDVERISFVDAQRWLTAAKPGELLKRLIENPDRPGRAEPRVRKRRPKQYPLMKEPRAILRNRLFQQKLAA
jgi:Transposase DDE domain